MTRNTLTNFRAEDFKGATRTVKQTKKAVAKKAAAETQQDPSKVPEGTTAEVLEWVGNDPQRAKKALQQENKNADPRVTLTGPLEKLIDDDKAARKAERDAAKQQKDTAKE